MRIRRITAIVATLWATALLLVIGAGPASAHEQVELGKVSFEIGFQNEPVYSGFQNAVFLSIQDGVGNPVTDAAETLDVEVGYGSQTMSVSLEPKFEAEEGGEPGQYLAHFIPTRPGEYTFHLSGSIDGEQIDRSFTSSPSTFDEAVDPTTVEFPVKDPTTGQLADRLTREFPRIHSAITDTSNDLANRVDSARLIGIIGLVVGALGFAVGVVALVRRTR
jgi:hypothetical protein